MTYPLWAYVLAALAYLAVVLAVARHQEMEEMMKVFMIQYNNDKPAPWLLDERDEMTADLNGALLDAATIGQSIEVHITIDEMSSAEFRRHLDDVGGYSEAFNEMQRNDEVGVE